MLNRNDTAMIANTRRKALDNAEFGRIQDEIITAKWISRGNPAIGWTACLKLAKKYYDNKGA